MTFLIVEVQKKKENLYLISNFNIYGKIHPEEALNLAFWTQNLKCW
jgi:hypothetical protein